MTDFNNIPPSINIGRQITDQFFCNNIGVGCTNSVQNDGAESRCIIKKQGTDNNGKSLFEILDDNGNVLFDIDKDFNITWVNSDAHGTSTIKFTNQEIEIFAGMVAYNPGIEPSITSTGYLGTSSKKWYSAFFNNAYAVSFNTISDLRVKANIADADVATCMTNIRNLRLRNYNYATNSEPFKLFGNSMVTGLIAQEVKTTIPDAVNEGSGLLPDGTETSDFNYLRKNVIYMELLGAVKYLDSVVQAQATTISNLESRLSALESNQN